MHYLFKSKYKNKTNVYFNVFKKSYLTAVLRTKYDVLTSYERVEIRDYDEIWYIGSNSVQKIDIAYKKPTEKKHGEKPEVLNNGM